LFFCKTPAGVSSPFHWGINLNLELCCSESIFCSKNEGTLKKPKSYFKKLYEKWWDTKKDAGTEPLL